MTWQVTIGSNVATSGDDTLLGTAGNDYLNGGLGADLMIGGLGNDVFIVNDPGDRVQENAGEGIDTVRSAITYNLHAYGQHIENLTLLGNGNTNAIGNNLANTLIGNNGNNVLNGMGGNDLMIGGGGNDTFVVMQAGDRVRENAGQGCGYGPLHGHL